MRLTLQNGYPYPLPPGFDFDAYNPRMHWVSFEVRHFEWLHTLTWKRVKPRPSGRGRKARSPSGLLWAPPINQQP